MSNIQKFSTLQDAIELARFAHRSQTDQAGMPYIDHPMRVMQAVQAQGAQPYVQMAAILHDVTEDTTFTCQMLLDLGFSEAVVEIVKLVDRDYSANLFTSTFPFGADVSSDSFKSGADKFYYTNIKANPGALMVKLADIGDNTQPYRLAYLSKARQEKLSAKYEKALAFLLG